MFKITNAPITPGTHPANVNKKTIRIDPQPLSKTAKGGSKIDNKTLQKLMIEIKIKVIQRSGIFSEKAVMTFYLYCLKIPLSVAVQKAAF